MVTFILPDSSGAAQTLTAPRPVAAVSRPLRSLASFKAGKYKLTVRLTKAPDYGIVQVSVNGAKVGSPQDLFGAKVDVVYEARETRPLVATTNLTTDLSRSGSNGFKR